MNQTDLRNKKIAALREKREQATNRFFSSLDWARKSYDQDVMRLDQRLAKLEAVADDPVVLVRRSPGIPPVYHSAEHPCGNVPRGRRGRSHYEEMFLGEALAQGIRHCSFCGRSLKPATEEGNKGAATA